MVSFWPFKGDTGSAAAFEKTLSQLSGKINRGNTRYARLKLNKRRRRTLLTLYTSFTYIIISSILVLVTGVERWGLLEYATVIGGPFSLYGARRLLDVYYDYRISNYQAYLDSLNAQMEETIKKLKAATKYDSTQELLDKYGGAAQQPLPEKEKVEEKKSKQGPPPAPRTGFAPPATANIPSRQPPPKVDPVVSADMLPQLDRPMSGPGGVPAMPIATEPGEEFAPNAFTEVVRNPVAPPQPPQYAFGGPKWYERIMDVILGEDEMLAKNRIVLICQTCRLVNGQAPPGTKSLEDMGKWKCSSCHAWNGVQREERSLLSKISDQTTSPSAASVPDPAPNATAVAEQVVAGAEPETADEEAGGDRSDDDSGDFEHVGDDVDEDVDGGAKSTARPTNSMRRRSARLKA